MGEVFLAEDPDLERLVAVKVLSPQAATDPEAQARFQREAKTLAALNHPGIVTIYEIGRDGDQQFISMELVSGKTLREELSRGQMPVARLLEVAIHVAEALAAAHAAGVLHRDIKPDNVMVCAGAIKVVDFGVARRLETQRADRGSGDLMAALAQTMPIGEAGADTVTADTNTIFGTPGYMAPEILCGDGSSAKSDVYSFGVLIYEAIAGELPFRGHSLMDLLGDIMDPKKRPPRLDASDGEPAVSPAMADLVDAMLARDPDRRPTMAEVRDNLGAIIAAADTTDLSTARDQRAVAAATIPMEGRPRRWWPLIAACAAMAAIAVFAIARMTSNTSSRASDDPARAAAEPPADSIRVALAPVAVSGIPHVAARSYAIADLVGAVLAQAPAFHVVGADALYFRKAASVDDPDARRAAARDCGAVYLMVTSITATAPRGPLSGTVAIIDVATGKVVAKPSAHAGDVGALVMALGKGVTRALAPSSRVKLVPVNRSIDSLAAYQEGMKAMFSASWSSAQKAFARATTVQPAFFEAWYHLALASAWNGSAPDITVRAAKKAAALATSARDKTLMTALLAYVARDFSRAATILAPLAATSEDCELLYLYAEALYHDGHYRAGLSAFDRVLRIAPAFGLAADHPLAAAIARRDANGARFYAGFSGRSDAWKSALAIARGDFDQVLMDDRPATRYVGLTLLGKLDRAGALLGKLPAGKWLAEPIARAAFAGHRAEAKAAFTRIFAPIKAAWGSHPETYLMAVGPLAETLIISDLGDCVAVLLDGTQKADPMFRTTVEVMRIHAAPLLSRPELLDFEPSTYLLRRQKQAIAAELSGDHVTAIHLWTRLLSDPGPTGDYLARFALARNLAALGRRDELHALCLDIARPAVYRSGMLPFVRRCLQWGGLERYPPRTAAVTP